MQKFCVLVVFCFFQAEDGIRDLVRSRGLGDVYKRQAGASVPGAETVVRAEGLRVGGPARGGPRPCALELSLIHI